jgi:hypothetical protein
LEVELAGARVCDVILQICEVRSLPPRPIFSRSQQSSADTSILTPAAYRDFSDAAVDHFPVRWIRRPVRIERL